MKRAMWTARCKSGIAFNGKTCNRITGRGQLLCTDCHTAITCYTAAPATWRYTDALFAIGAVVSLGLVAASLTL